MAASLMEGFNQYGKEHPEADYSGLQSSFEGYLKTDAAKKVMKEAILEIVKKTANVTVSNTQVQKLLSNLKEGFQKFFIQSKNLRLLMTSTMLWNPI